MARERTSLVIPLATTLLIHATFAAGLEAAELLVGKRPPPELQVAFELTPAPPPPPAPPPEPEPEAKPEPAPPPPKEPPPPKPVRPKKVASVAPPPAPGPPDEAPAPQRVYTLPGGGMEVDQGSSTGSATGTPGGTGKGRGGGAPVESTGTGGPKPVPLASVKSMPEPIGEYDYEKDYPPEARKLGIEGKVAVRLLVDETGHVAETKLARGLGHGLDEKALELVRRIRFKPARDDAERAVATWITWTVTFTLPR